MKLDEISALLSSTRKELEPYEVPEEERETAITSLEVGMYPGDQPDKYRTSGRKEFESLKTERQPLVDQVKRARVAEKELHDRESITGQIKAFGKNLFSTDDVLPVPPSNVTNKPGNVTNNPGIVVNPVEKRLQSAPSPDIEKEMMRASIADDHSAEPTPVPTPGDIPASPELFARGISQKMATATPGANPLARYDALVPSAPMSLGQAFAESGKAFMRGMGHTGGSALKGLGEIAYEIDQAMKGPEHEDKHLGDYATFQAGTKIAALTEKLFPGRKDLQDNFLLTTVPQALGSSAVFLGLGVGATTLGAGAGVTAATSGALVGASSLYEKGMQSNVTTEQKRMGLAIGGLLGLTEGLPIADLFRRINTATGGTLANAVKIGTIQAIEEALQEGFQQIGENAAVKYVYGKAQEMAEGVAPGMGAGGLVGFLTGAILARRGKHGNTLEQAEPITKVQPSTLDPNAAGPAKTSASIQHSPFAGTPKPKQGIDPSLQIAPLPMAQPGTQRLIKKATVPPTVQGTVPATVVTPEAAPTTINAPSTTTLAPATVTEQLPAQSVDEQYEQAKALVLSEKTPSPSLIQRRLRIGYPQAARLIERMQNEGLVSATAPDGSRSLIDQPEPPLPPASVPSMEQSSPITAVTPEDLVPGAAPIDRSASMPLLPESIDQIYERGDTDEVFSGLTQEEAAQMYPDEGSRRQPTVRRGEFAQAPEPDDLLPLGGDDDARQEPEDTTVEEIHMLAEQRGMKWDNDKAFMDLTERVTGKRHLDALSQQQLNDLSDVLYDPGPSQPVVKQEVLPTPAPIANSSTVATPTDLAAHGAATSPVNTVPEPTEAMKKAGDWSRTRIPQETRDEAVRLYQAGLTQQQVADELGVSDSAVFRSLKEASIPARKFESLHNKKSDQLKEEAIRLYVDEKKTLPEVAKRLNIGQTTVARWVKLADVGRSQSEALAMASAQGRRPPRALNIPWQSTKTNKWEFADSKWEAVRMSQLDADESVKSWTKLAERVPYTDAEGKQRHYAPDFLVEYNDGRSVVEEIKPEGRVSEPKNVTKANAAREFFKAKNIDYRVVTENEIGTDDIDAFEPEGFAKIAEQERDRRRLDRRAKAARDSRAKKNAAKTAQPDEEKHIAVMVAGQTDTVNVNPSEAQKESGIYKKAHVQIAGLDISIENPAGSERSGVGANGKPWSQVLHDHYGYILGTVGKDKDHLDIFIKPGTPKDYGGPMYVVDQKTPSTGRFDEHKIIAGASSTSEARQVYTQNYAKGWDGIQTLKAFTMSEFKDWLKNGNHKEPAARFVQTPVETKPFIDDDKPKPTDILAKALRTAADEIDRKPEPVAASKKPKKEPDGIQDVGEKIGGARKDKWAERGLTLADLEGMTGGEEAKYIVKPNIWRPDYAEMVTAGTEPKAAALVKIVYDKLSAKPVKDTPEGRRAYLTMMGHIKEAYATVKTVQDVEKARNAVFETIGWGTKSRDAATREIAFSVYKNRHEPFSIGYSERAKAEKMVTEGFPAQEPWTRRYEVGKWHEANGLTDHAAEVYAKRVFASDDPWKTTFKDEQALADRFKASGIWRVTDRSANKTIVAYRPDEASAKLRARQLYEEKKGAPDEGKEPVRPHLDDLKRTGADYRNGKDVTAEDFRKVFGFRGVEFGNWAASDERQKHINQAYDALRDMADLLGMPSQAISLNGTLGLAFGARGGGHAAAHYEPSKLVINITKINGPGALAHEWGHALDHYFGELNRPDAYKGKARGASGWRDRMRPGTLTNLRPEMAKAFDDVIGALFSRDKAKADVVRERELHLERIQGDLANSIERLNQAQEKPIAERNLERIAQLQDIVGTYKSRAEAAGKGLATIRNEDRPAGGYGTIETSYYRAAQKLSGKTGDYWKRPTEMFARAFESYVFDRLGRQSDYLVHGVEPDRYTKEKGFKENPYPAGTERESINGAFNKLFDTMETKQTDQGIASFMRVEGEGGEKRAAAGMDPRIMKVLGGNLYSGDLGKIAVKEMLQNAVDGIRALPKGREGKIDVDIDTKRRMITVSDTGSGMTPDIATKELLDIGGSKKSEGSSGGFGIAKVAIFANAEQIEISTRTPNENGEMMETVLYGSGEDWMDQSKGLHVETRPTSLVSGTTIQITLRKEVQMNEYAVGTWIQNFQEIHRLPMNVDMTFDGREVKARRTALKPVMKPFIFDGGTIHFYSSDEASGRITTAPDIDILNNGLPQFISHVWLGGGNGVMLPHTIVADIRSKAGPEESNYPFTPDRERLRQSAQKAVEEAVREMAADAIKKENNKFVAALAKAPEVPGTTYKVFDTAELYSPEQVKALAEKPYIKELTQVMGRVFTAVQAVLQKSDPAMANVKFEGIGLGDQYLGVNITGNAIQEGRQNLILLNPFTIMAEVQNQTENLLIDAADEPATFAEQVIATIVHELSHQQERGHGEKFAGALTRNQGRSIMVSATGMRTIKEAIVTVPERETPTSIFSFLKGGRHGSPFSELTKDLIAIRKAWSKGTDVFSQISSSHAGERGRSKREGDSDGREATGARSQNAVPERRQDPALTLAESPIVSRTRSLIANERGSIPVSPVTLPKFSKEAKTYKALRAKQDLIGFSSSDEDIEARVRAAKKGLKPEGIWSRLKEHSESVWHLVSREFEHLPDTAQFSRLRTDLLQLAKYKGIAADQVQRDLAAIIKPLSRTQYDQFEWKALLSDLVREAQQDRALPFGYTKEKVQEDLDRLDQVIERDPKVQEAWSKRQELWKTKKAEYQKAMDAIGFDTSKKLTKEDYFRHQVLEHARERHLNGTGSKVRTPTGRGFLKARHGSTMDINANYVQAEFEVMAQMVYDTKVAKVIGNVDTELNIRPALEQEAKARNADAMQRKIDEGGVAGAIIEATMKDFRKRIGMHMGMARKALELDKHERITLAELAEIADDPESPANLSARGVFKAISERKQYVKDLLAEDFKTWDQLVPDTHDLWQPREGNVFYMADSIPAQLAKALQEGMLDASGFDVDKLKKVMAMGMKREQYVIPVEAKETLDALSQKPKNWFVDMNRSLISHWKQLMLIAPRKVLRYNVRNLTGDGDAMFVGNPRSFLKLKDAAKDLFPVIFKDTVLTGEAKHWAERGGYGTTLQWQELGDINDLKAFKATLDRESKGGWLSLPATAWNGYWKAARLGTDYREAMMRYATYLDYLEQMQQSATGRPKNFGASIPATVMALTDLRDRAFKMSNELLGAYDRVSVAGHTIRQFWIPFWSWQEVNATRYYRLVKNALEDQDGGAGARLAAVGAKKATMTSVRAAAFLIKMSMFWSMLQAWNLMMYGDDEDELRETNPTVANRPHILFGRGDDGKIRYLAGIGALGDLLAWFGLDSAPGLVGDVMHDRMTIGEAFKHVVKAPVNKIVGGLTPTIKMPVELLSRENFYPDPFHPRPIQDRGDYLGQQTTFGPEINALRGKPGKPIYGGDDLTGLLIQRSDPKSSAYGTWQGIEQKYLERMGKESSAMFWRSPRGEALSNWSRAIKDEDLTAEAHWKAEYERLEREKHGQKFSQSKMMSDLEKSLRSKAPLAGVTKAERDTIVKGLESQERRTLEKAEAYYKDVILQVLPESRRRAFTSKLQQQHWLSRPSDQLTPELMP